MARQPRPGIPHFSQTPEGQAVFLETARWVYRRMGRKGVQKFLRGRRHLRDFGITAQNAFAELQPRIPDAHDWYNLHGDGSRRFATWAEFWQGYLANRVYHWFHGVTPTSGRRKVRTLAHGEWPGTKYPFAPR